MEGIEYTQNILSQYCNKLGFDFKPESLVSLINLPFRGTIDLNQGESEGEDFWSSLDSQNPDLTLADLKECLLDQICFNCDSEDADVAGEAVMRLAEVALFASDEQIKWKAFKYLYDLNRNAGFILGPQLLTYYKSIEPLERDELIYLHQLYMNGLLEEEVYIQKFSLLNLNFSIIGALFASEDLRGYTPGKSNTDHYENVRLTLDLEYKSQIADQIAESILNEKVSQRIEKLGCENFDIEYINGLNSLLKLFTFSSIQIELEKLKSQSALSLNYNKLYKLVEKRFNHLDKKHKLIIKELPEYDSKYYKYVPTSGLEIQTTGLISFPAVKNNSLISTFLNKKDTDKFSEIVGFFKSKDDFYEFALQPSRSMEVQLLMYTELGRLNFFNRYRFNGLSVQLNFGGVKCKPSKNYSMDGENREISKLQIYTSSAGIAHNNFYFSNIEEAPWEVKGISALRNEGVGGANYFMRNKVGKDPVSELRITEKIDETKFFKNALISRDIATSIKAFQKSGDERDGIENTLAGIWQNVEKDLDNLFKEKGLNISGNWTKEQFSKLHEILKEEGDLTSYEYSAVVKVIQLRNLPEEFEQLNFNIKQVEQQILKELLLTNDEDSTKRLKEELNNLKILHENEQRKIKENAENLTKELVELFGESFLDNLENPNRLGVQIYTKLLHASGEVKKIIEN